MTDTVCDYHGCEEVAVWLHKGTDPTWNLCQEHLSDLDSLLDEEPFNAKKLLRFWARGQSPEEKDKMAKQVAEGAMKLCDICKQVKKGGK